MSKSALCTLLALLFSCLTLPAGNIEGKPPLGKGIVTAKTELTIRSRPNSHCERIGSIPSGTEITIYSENNGWYEIPLPPESKVWIAAESVDAQGVVLQNNVPLYAGPGVMFTIFGTVKQGTQLKLSPKEMVQFRLVQAPQDITGWVNRNFVKTDFEEAEQLAAKKREQEEAASLQAKIRALETQLQQQSEQLASAKENEAATREKLVAAEKNVQETNEKLVAAEKIAQENAEKLTAAQQTAQENAEKLNAAQQTAQENAEKLNAAQQTAQENAEKLNAVQQTAQENAEKLNAAEQAAKENAEKLNAAEQAAKENAEKLNAAEQAAKENAEKLNAAEQAAKENAEKLNAAEQAAKENAAKLEIAKRDAAEPLQIIYEGPANTEKKTDRQTQKAAPAPRPLFFGVVVGLGPKATALATHVLYDLNQRPVCFLNSKRISLNPWENSRVELSGFVQHPRGWTLPLVIVTDIMAK